MSSFKAADEAAAFAEGTSLETKKSNWPDDTKVVNLSDFLREGSRAGGLDGKDGNIEVVAAQSFDNSA